MAAQSTVAGTASPSSVSKLNAEFLPDKMPDLLLSDHTFHRGIHDGVIQDVNTFISLCLAQTEGLCRHLVLIVERFKVSPNRLTVFLCNHPHGICLLGGCLSDVPI